MTGCRNRKSFTLGRTSASPSNTRGGSRMREFRTYGSVRGAHGNGRPYRNRLREIGGEDQAGSMLPAWRELRTPDDASTEGDPGQGRPAGIGQAARQCEIGR